MLIPDNIVWNEQADVVIVGLGGAGAVAAMTARDSGASVIVLEKQPADDHVSTTHTSVGAILCPTDVEKATTYLENLSKFHGGPGWTDSETCRAWAKYSCQNKDWIEKLGVKLNFAHAGGEHKFPGGECLDGYFFPGMGYAMMRILKKQVESRNVIVLYSTPATHILTNTSGEVLGIRALSDGKEINVKANRGVILAPGGFEFNEEMKLNYLKVYPCYCGGSVANTGDGHKMVQEIGADLWHMNCFSGQWAVKTPISPIGISPNYSGIKSMLQQRHGIGNPCGYVIVDKKGKRYTNEKNKRHTTYYELDLYDEYAQDYPRIPSYWIFDKKRIDSGPLTAVWHGIVLERYIPWSKDNRAEIEKGWITEAQTIEELAAKIKVNPPALKKTVDDYNTYCERKEDPEFHRPPQDLVPLVEPPFYAVALWPGGPNTQGGPRRNARAQVIGVSGKPIPRLYAAGEFGSVYGMLYPSGGGNLAECIAFGRIAGENAAGEIPAE